MTDPLRGNEIPDIRERHARASYPRSDGHSDAHVDRGILLAEVDRLQEKHAALDLAFRRLLDAAKHVRATLAFDALTVTQEELHEFMSKAVAEAELARKR